MKWAWSLTIVCFFSILVSVHVSVVFPRTNGSPGGNTGSLSEERTCSRPGCHSGLAIPREEMFSTDIPPTGYLAGQTYEVSLTIEEDDIVKFGFEATAEDEEGEKAGEIAVINPTETKKVIGSNITHTLSGTGGMGSRTWTFSWHAPSEAGTGEVTFYAAVNASNNMNNASGDKIYTTQLSVQEDPMSSVFDGETAFNRFEIYPNPASSHFLLNCLDVKSDFIVLRVLTLQGVEVVNQRLNFENNQKTLSIKTADWGLKPGVYGLIFSTPERSYFRKLLLKPSYY